MVTRKILRLIYHCPLIGNHSAVYYGEINVKVIVALRLSTNKGTKQHSDISEHYFKFAKLERLYPRPLNY